MGTVTIGTDTADVYGTLVGATSYMNIHIGPQYAKWRGLSADDKARTLVQAKDYLDSLRLEADGAPITFATGILAVQYASYEMAALIAQTPTIVSALSTGSNIKSVGAGPAAVEFWAPVNGPRVPILVLNLLSEYLPSTDTGSSTDGGGEALGTGACPTFTPRCTCSSGSSCTCEGGINMARNSPL